MYYLDTATVKRAYENLTSKQLRDSNIVHYFIIMKACGINRLSFESTDFISHNGLYYASRISSLFSPVEEQPKKFGFINPFAMSKWPAQPVSETLTKWITSRLKNNILGGGMQWRSLVEIDTKSEEKKVKFKYDYVNLIKNMAFDSDMINIVSLAIWANRFTEFQQQVTEKELADEFIRTYNIDVDEMEAFFNTQQEYDISYSEVMHDAGVIRGLIGKPNEDAWKPTELSQQCFDEYVLSKYEFNIQPAKVQDVTLEMLNQLLCDYSQLILAGPPGTSKSYYASEVAKGYDKVIHVQFHPQYSYQNFVGGYVVDKTDVIFRKGVLLNLVASDDFSEDKKYLIIIDEFNRANVSQVLGEAIQCLDRNQSVDISMNGELQTISLPKNVHIIATLNTTDRTLGTVDYAIKRRFMNVYCPPNPNLLIGLCPSAGFVSLCDFLTKINKKIIQALGSREMCVGHAIFLSDSVKVDGKYLWNFETFRILYNYKILPMIEDYCSNNTEIIEDVVGFKLASQLDQEDFEGAIKEFMEI